MWCSAGLGCKFARTRRVRWGGCVARVLTGRAKRSHALRPLRSDAVLRKEPRCCKLLFIHLHLRGGACSSGRDYFMPGITIRGSCEFSRGMVGSAGACQPAAAARRSQARRRARPAYDAGVHVHLRSNHGLTTVPAGSVEGIVSIRWLPPTSRSQCSLVGPAVKRRVARREPSRWLPSTEVPLPTYTTSLAMRTSLGCSAVTASRP